MSRRSRLEVGFAQDRVPIQVVDDHPAGAFQQRALREHVRPFSDATQRVTDDLLGTTEPVRGGGVYPIDPVFNGVLNCRDRLMVVLWSPSELPATATERPCSESDAADVQACLGQALSS